MSASAALRAVFFLTFVDIVWYSLRTTQNVYAGLSPAEQLQNPIPFLYHFISVFLPSSLRAALAFLCCFDLLFSYLVTAKLELNPSCAKGVNGSCLFNYCLCHALISVLLCNAHFAVRNWVGLRIRWCVWIEWKKQIPLAFQILIVRTTVYYTHKPRFHSINVWFLSFRAIEEASFRRTLWFSFLPIFPHTLGIKSHVLRICNFKQMKSLFAFVTILTPTFQSDQLSTASQLWSALLGGYGC